MLPMASAPRRSPEMRRITLSSIACLMLAATLAATLARAASDDPKLLFSRGCLRQAGAACEQRLAANPGDAGAGAVLARIRAEQGDLDRALELATAAVAADPKSADAQYALAEVYGRKAQTAGMLKAAGLAGKMRKAAEAALAIDPKPAHPLDIIVDVYSIAP